MFGKQVGKVKVALLTLYKRRTVKYNATFFVAFAKPVVLRTIVILKFEVPFETPRTTPQPRYEQIYSKYFKTDYAGETYKAIFKTLAENKGCKLNFQKVKF